MIMTEDPSATLSPGDDLTGIDEPARDPQQDEVNRLVRAEILKLRIRRAAEDWITGNADELPVTMVRSCDHERDPWSR
jgi:hypothetical protein